MASFSGIARQHGFTPGAEPFLMVPLRRPALLMLHSGKDYRVFTSNSRIRLEEHTRREVSPELQEYLGHARAGLDNMEMQSKLWAVAQRSMAFHGRLFTLTGRSTGLSRVYAVNKRQRLHVDVAICARKSIHVAFRFMQHPDGRGGVKPATRWNPGQAEWMVANTNAIYVPQVNIGFELVDSRWFTVQPLHQPIGDEAFREYIAQHRSTEADVTVFFIGTCKFGSDQNGVYIHDLRSVAIDDNPVHAQEDPFADWSTMEPDPFALDPIGEPEPVILTIAHELAHHILASRNLSGHHNTRHKTLLSLGIEAATIDNQQVAVMNPW